MTLRTPISAKQRAVVVDDSKSSLALMVQLLKSIEGCEPIGFEDSGEALAWCLTNEVDLLVLDYHMPNPDGIAFIQSFRRDPANAAIPVVMVTSTSDRDIRYMALQMGATDFLTKPVDKTEFIARARNLLATSLANKTLEEVSQWLTDEVRKTSMVLRQSPSCVMITDRQGVIEYINPKFTEVTGYAMQELIGKDARLLRSGLTPDQTYSDLWQTIESGENWRGTLQNRRKDGSLVWQSELISPIRDASGQITHYVAILEDMTERMEIEAKLEWQANYDSLTGLPNRSLLIDRLGQVIARTDGQADKVAVLVINLNRFKTINEVMGLDAGDHVLREIAARLQGEQRRTGGFARLGNDQFALTLSDPADAASPQTAAARICELLTQPILFGENEIFVSARIGIAVFPDDGDTPEALLRRANSAASCIESDLRAGWRFYTAQLDEGARRRQALEAHMRRALERGEFYLCYHPLVAVDTQRIIGAEALLRWSNAELGMVRPDEFIPIAEETGLIVPIGAWVIDTVVRDIARWRALGKPTLRVAVNVSSVQLTDRSLVHIISQSLSRHDIPSDKLELEVTERLLLDTTEHTTTLLGDLRAMGLRFSIDDFGTGYSAMSYLTTFRFDVLKIDRSFISKVTEQPRDAALTQAIIAMAQSLEMEVVAEGVETELQLEFLRRNNCNFAQGFLFTKPLMSDEFKDLI